jgi:hypothetical protein
MIGAPAGSVAVIAAVGSVAVRAAQAVAGSAVAIAPTARRAGAGSVDLRAKGRRSGPVPRAMQAVRRGHPVLHVRRVTALPAARANR